MAGKKTAVFGIYPDRASVDRGVEALKAAGFSNNDVSVLFPDKQGTKDFAHEKETKAPEGAATGAGTGAVLGGGLGWLAGIGALAIPGLGPFIAAGPIMAALAGAGVGGAVGGLTGALIGMGIPEYEAKRYEGRVKDGGILPVRTLGQFGGDQKSEGNIGTDWRSGRFFDWRGQRRQEHCGHPSRRCLASYASRAAVNTRLCRRPDLRATDCYFEK